jgi:hypothetical protein
MDHLNDLNTISGILSASVFFIIGVIVIQLTRHRDSIADQTKIFILSFAVRMVMVIVTYYMGLLKILGDEDSGGWVNGYLIYDKWLQEGQTFFSLPIAIWDYVEAQRDLGAYHYGYFLVVAVQFYVSNLPGRISAAALNVLFGSMVPVLAFRMCNQLFDNIKSARYVAWSLAFMPSLVVFSAQTLKEPVVVFLEVLCLYCCLQIAQFKIRFRHLIVLFVGIAVMSTLRFYVSYVIVGTFVLTLIIPPIFKSKYKKVFIGMVMLLSPLVFIVTYRSAIIELDQVRVEQSRKLQNYSKGFGDDTNFQLNSNVRNPFDITVKSEILPGLLFGFLHLMYAPFPWQLLQGSLRMSLTAPEMVWWYYNGSIRLFRGIRNALKTNFIDSIIPIAFCLPLLLFYSLIFNNIGLAYRYRAQILPEFLIFIALGYHNMKVIAMNQYSVEEDDLSYDFEEEPEPIYSSGLGFKPGYYGLNQFGQNYHAQAQSPRYQDYYLD